MSDERPLFVPVILGTVRRGRASEPVARLIHAEVGKRSGVETQLIDLREIPLPVDDAGEAIKSEVLSASLSRADAVIIVTPEYNHGYPGLLKHALDSCLEEYVHKAAGIVGVSAGPWGGTRVVETLLPVLRELGLVTIFWDVQFPHAGKSFDPDGKLLDEKFLPRIDKFLKELFWMARTLRHGREHVPLG